MSPPKRRRLAKSVYADRSGISGVVRVRGITEELRFPHGTPVTEIHREISKRREVLEQLLPAAPERGTVAAVIQYAIDQADPSDQANRRQLLTPWIEALGADTRWHTLSRRELADVVAQWQRGGLSAGRARKRLTALRSAWKAQAPDHALPHPILHVALPTEPRATAIRARPLALIDLVLAHVTETKDVKKGRDPVLSKSRARLGVLAWTGQPPARVMQIRREHVRWTSDPPELYVSPRRKGAGSDDAWLPLLPQAVTWLKVLFASDATGTFSMSALGRVWQRALARTKATLLEQDRKDEAAQLDGFRVYDLRHSALTALAIATDDIYAVKEYAGHASIQTTLRYMRGAAGSRTRAAIAKLADQHAAELPTKNSHAGRAKTGAKAASVQNRGGSWRKGRARKMGLSAMSKKSEGNRRRS